MLPGYQVNDRLHPYFVETKIAGNDPGTAANLVCAYEGRPVVVVYTWSINPDVVHLIRKLDSAVAKHEAERLACYVVLFSEGEEGVGELKALAEKEAIRHVLLSHVAVDRFKLRDPQIASGMREFLVKFDRTAETRVFLVSGEKLVRAVHPYRKGELNKEEADRILKDLPAIMIDRTGAGSSAASNGRDGAPLADRPGKERSGRVPTTADAGQAQGRILEPARGVNQIAVGGQRQWLVAGGKDDTHVFDRKPTRIFEDML